MPPLSNSEDWKMTPERFRQVRNVFEAALERIPGDRSAFLDEAVKSDDDLRAHAKRMLEAYERTVTFLDGSDTAPVELRTDPRRMEGRRLGAYEVLREIGRGGMGTVYLARRADGLFEQQVAIKVVNPENSAREIVERFEQERAILASLEHPNIARLYDGGSTEEGWPYFVMEYVEGKPIDDWCDERKLNISARVALFRTICGAVHFAHQRRVIHRDLKPGNILVTEDGTVKLLDFGIAKLVRVDADQKTVLATRTGIRLMTPEYASPEQIRAEATTPLTDLYSLGVILYELLTGRRPYPLKSRVFHEIVRVVCEEPPTRPSTAVTEADQRPGDEGKTITIAPGLFSQTREGTPSDLKRRLSGDLDGILLKTLEKDPRQRYRSVEQLSTDLERHLNGQPIIAGHSGWLADSNRFLSRHRMTIVAVVVLLVALWTGGIRIDWRGVALIFGAAALSGLWHLATDPELAARYSGHTYAIGGAIAALFLLIAGVAGSSLKYLYPGLSSNRVVMALAIPPLAIASIYLITLLVAWTFRNRWAGGLITKMRLEPTSGFVFLLVMIANLPDAVSNVFHGGEPVNKTLNQALVVMIALAFLGNYTLLKVLEVRERGLLYCGRLISWLDIEGYTWEITTPRQELVVFSMRRPKRLTLCLKVRRLLRILPAIRIPIPSGYQAELERILDRHLSEWPDDRQTDKSTEG